VVWVVVVVLGTTSPAASMSACSAFLRCRRYQKSELFGFSTFQLGCGTRSGYIGWSIALWLWRQAVIRAGGLPGTDTRFLRFCRRHGTIPPKQTKTLPLFG